MYCAVNAVCAQTSAVTWNRIATVREAATARHRTSPMYETFRAAAIAESANVDFTTPRGRAGLCVSFDRADGRLETSRAIAELLAPSFEAGIARFLLRVPVDDDDGVLTRREREVARMLVARRMNHEIAAALEISEHTVRHHIENIFSKLGVRSRHDVAKRLRSDAGQRSGSRHL